MFDIGFWELTVIAIIALVVIGPDRLPEFARTTGLWIGKARRFFSSVKSDIDRELQAEELKRMIRPSEFDEIHEIIEETKTTVTDTVDNLSAIDPPAAASAPSSAPASESLPSGSDHKPPSEGVKKAPDP
uniref:Sec-independent protein translocase protein TatB n=1 Tax=Candidatus Kentrum sp. FM TaxID=2126340 RepID=A0A450WFR7_9GAMM|nr:MAG: sec-independent protein translocase protein TatB [Candidatus Kentron sp. FM]VFJ68896.1 MAG: sec-independent protein translocase protein TatB [Candidatus Kentron sp. FM]VFK15890.1 MAG: sec-independent protein translocase protein TatB [Candidatus Kentron sp. FM]